MAAAYSAWQEGDVAAARARAEEALRLDESVRTLVARRVLVLALDAQGEAAAALAALEELLSFALTERDRAWAQELLPTLRSKVPAAPSADASTTDPRAGRGADGAEVVGPAAAGAERSPGPARPAALTVAVGGGYARLASWDYGGASLHALVRLAGPLHLDVGARLLLSGPTGCGGAEASAPGDTCRALLVAPGFGVLLRAPLAPAAPFLSVRATVAPERGVPDRPPVRVGGTLEGGVEIVLGASPLALRPRAALDVFGGGGSVLPGVFAGLDLAVRIGGRSP